MRSFAVFVALVLLFPLQVSATATQSTAIAAEQSSRWTLRLSHKNQSWFHEDIWLTERPDGTARMVVIGPASLVAEGRRKGNALEFDSNGVRLSLIRKGNVLTGRWSRGLGSGEATGEMVAAELAQADFPALFDRIAATMQSRYYDPTFGGQNWQAYQARYRPAAVAARNEAEFTLAIRQMLSDLKISHLGFYRNDRPANAAAPELPSGPEVNWLSPRPGVGYIRIKDFVQSPAELARLDQAFVELASTHSLIVDLRENGGGNIYLGMRLADHLLPTQRSLGIFVTQAGLASAGATSIAAFPADRATVYEGYDTQAFIEQLRRTGAVRLSAGGRAFKQARKVYVLTDRKTGSAAEAVAAALQDEGAIIIGDRSAGAMLVGAREEVAPQWILRFPEADYRTEKGQILERVGVQPNVRGNPRRAYDTALDLIAK